MNSRDYAASTDDGGLIRMSVLNAILEIQDFLAASPGVSAAEAARILQKGLSSQAPYAYVDALTAGAARPELFDTNAGGRVSRLRAVLKTLLKLQLPAWGHLIPKGRSHLGAYLVGNCKQCFESAHLYSDVLDPEGSEFWYELAAFFRSQLDVRNANVGRRGELLTMDYETRRLVNCGRPYLVPRWVAIDDNTLGYDVHSFEPFSDGVADRFIEVKATTATPLRFYLTRHEWDEARMLADKFRLHIWYLPTQTLVEMTVSELETSIPIDQGKGEWETLICFAV